MGKKSVWGVCLALLISPCFADDEVLDAAEAVREMIQGMDIPQAEKDRFLAQIQGVEGIQKTAIGLDIDAALQEFEQVAAEWSVIHNAQLENLRERQRLLDQGNEFLDSGDLIGAQVVRDLITVKEKQGPTDAERQYHDTRVKTQNAECVALIREAEEDGVDVSAYLLRLLDIREEIPSHVWQ